MLPPPQKNSHLRFSIIIPVYNTEKYLRQCIDSVLNQSFTDYELWLVDDGSTDASISIIKEYAARDERIKTAFIKGTGPAMPRNYGLKRASGEYILFVDSDDYLTQDALKHFEELIKNNPDADFIKSNQLILMDDQREVSSIFSSWRAPFDSKIMSGEGLMTKVLKTDFTPTNSLFRRKLLESKGLFFHENLVLLEDVPFIMELCSIAKKCLYTSRETYVYRLFSETSLTRSKRTLPKVLSLSHVASCEKSLMGRFYGDGQDLVERRYVEHYISSMFQACTELTRSESLTVFDSVRSVVSHLPHKGRSVKHKIGIFLYNISPRLLHDVLRSGARFIKNT